MAGSSQQTARVSPQTEPEQVAEFVNYLVQVLEKATAPPADELARLVSQLDQTGPEDKPRHIAKPPAFYRMSSILYRNPNPTMGELSHALSVPLPTATRMANWWVDNGYAQRLPDASDRRVVRVALTDRGRRLHEVMEGHIGRSVQKVLACLTPRERGTLVGYLAKIAAALKEDAG
jgi:DNA-binding MarR family transcriptional regulator